MGSFYVTTAIPYVNAATAPRVRAGAGAGRRARPLPPAARRRRPLPHRHRRQQPQERARRRGARASRSASSSTATRAVFAALREPLGISFDDFIRTSADPRHRAGRRAALARRATRRGDIYRAALRGPLLRRLRAVLRAGRAGRRRAARSTAPPGGCRGGELLLPALALRRRSCSTLHRVRRAARRARDRASNEVLRLHRAAASTTSASRARRRGRAAGASRCPATPTQVIYVWFDALANYITALGLRRPTAARFARYWLRSRRSGPRHRQGHRALPRRLLAGDAAVGRAAAAARRSSSTATSRATDAKISKSLGTAVDPVALVRRLGRRPLSLLAAARGPGGRGRRLHRGRFAQAYNADLANDLGNLLHRTVSLLHRARDGVVRSGEPDALRRWWRQWPTSPAAAARARRRLGSAPRPRRHLRRRPRRQPAGGGD